MSSGGYPDPENTSGGGHGPYHGHNGYQHAPEPNEGTLIEVLRAQNQQMPVGPSVLSDPQMAPPPMNPMNGHQHATSNSPGQLDNSPPQYLDPHGGQIDEHGQLLHYQAYQPNDPNSADSARKRSKVSRACDECRRKKIRCDANPDGGPEACSSCKRTNMSCRFSRQPMKRGPSKGYIKELADRLGTVEAQVQGRGPIPYALEGMAPDQFPLGELLPSNRKRPFDASEGFESGYPQSAADATAGAQQQHPQWTPNDGGFAVAQPGIFNFDGEIINEARRLFQELLPFLPYKPNRIVECLSRADRELQELFAISANLAVRTYPTVAPNLQNMPNVPASNSRASTLVSLFEDRASASSHAPMIINSIVFLQSLIFLSIWAMNERRTNIHWLDRAVSHANAVQLYRIPNIEWLREDPDDWDTDQKLPRRILLVLFVLDRWHSAGTASPARLPFQICGSIPEDQRYMGASAWHMIRISRTLSDIVDMLLASNAPQSFANDKQLALAKENPATLRIRHLIMNQIEAISETAVALKSPQVNCAIQHARLLITALDPMSSIEERHAEAVKVVDLISIAQSSFSLLDYHLDTLAAIVLSQSLHDDRYKQEAEQKLMVLEQYINAVRTLPQDARMFGWDSLVQEFIQKKRAPDVTGDALNSLASAAANGDGTGDGNVDAVPAGLDLSNMMIRIQLATGDQLVSQGYFVVLKQQLGV